MDRNIIYADELPAVTDLLSTNKNVLVALGLLMQDLFGTGTLVGGLTCTQTAPASMNVQIGAGRLYSLQGVDTTAYSVIAADTTHQIIKQGIAQDAQTLACPAPGTAGNSIAYLIEASYQEIDTNLITLPYYNNGGTPLSGPGGNGSAQPTTRAGRISVVAKPGISAATGSQQTPAVDSGYVPLYVVTVAYGATTITSANIVKAANAPFLTETLLQKISQATADTRYGIVTQGTCVLQLNHCTTTPTGTARWLSVAGPTGAMVTLILPVLTAVSSDIYCDLSLVSGILPLPSSSGQWCPLAMGMDNGSNVGTYGALLQNGAPQITIYKNGLPNTFTAAGNKGVNGYCPITYLTI